MNKTGVFASARSLVGGLPGVGELTNVLGEIGTAAAISGHSRDLETEADMEGIKLLVKAGYDPREAPKLFRHLKDELDEEEEKEPFFFGSHPRLADRIDYYDKFLKEPGGGTGGALNTDAFRKKVARVVIENAFMDFRAGRFPQAKTEAEKYIATHPKDGRGYYLMGEIARQKGEDSDMTEAMKQFQKGVSVDPAYADSHKGLGLLYFKEGKKSQAAKAFKAYLVKAPHAPDRSYIEDYLSQCR
jgi:predicted Zn-dependent protease